MVEGGLGMRQTYEITDPVQGHKAVDQLYRNHVKPHTVGGGRGWLVWQTSDRDCRTALRGLFHGPILTDFAEQVRLQDPVTGRRVRYAPAVWKEHLKDLFCPVTLIDGEPTKSTEALTDFEFSEFIEQCRAYGVIELGVAFTEQEP